jgi:hypothetical protein
LSARPRKHRRQRPNLRRNARGRPQMLQRLRCWVENFGFLFVLAIFAVVAIFSFARPLGHRFGPLALSYWPLVLPKSSCIYHQLCLNETVCIFQTKPRANSQWLRASLLPERHSKMLEQCTRLIVVARRGHDRYVHALQLVHFRVIDFRENQLIAQAQRVIAATIK